jgi:hypothetical protein
LYEGSDFLSDAQEALAKVSISRKGASTPSEEYSEIVSLKQD